MKAPLISFCLFPQTFVSLRRFGSSPLLVFFPFVSQAIQSGLTALVQLQARLLRDLPALNEPVLQTLERINVDRHLIDQEVRQQMRMGAARLLAGRCVVGCYCGSCRGLRVAMGTTVARGAASAADSRWLYRPLALLISASCVVWHSPYDTTLVFSCRCCCCCCYFDRFDTIRDK